MLPQLSVSLNCVKEKTKTRNKRINMQFLHLRWLRQQYPSVSSFNSLTDQYYQTVSSRREGEAVA